MLETLSRWVLLDTRNKTFLSKEIFLIAARIFAFHAEKTHWVMDYRWPTRAFAMGIDSKTIRVVDERRFKWFWYQLGETGRFSIKKQRELMKSGKEPPGMQPLIITKPYIDPGTIKQRQQAKEVKQASDNYLKDEIINHFFV